MRVHAVKNVSGRLLVGLRWFNVIDENGKSNWQFMSYEDQRIIHPMDSNVFWVALFAAPAVWILIAISTVCDADCSAGASVASTSTVARVLHPGRS